MKSLKSCLNKVFCQNDTPDTSETSLNPSGEVINTPDTDGIGEPILSFIETYRSDRKRFTVTSDSLLSGWYYLVTDNKTKTIFDFSYITTGEYSLYSYRDGIHKSQINCFSQKELKYLFAELLLPEMVKYNKVVERKNRISSSRQKRLQREQLMEVYCNE